MEYMPGDLVARFKFWPAVRRHVMLASHPTQEGYSKRFVQRRSRFQKGLRYVHFYFRIFGPP